MLYTSVRENVKYRHGDCGDFFADKSPLCNAGHQLLQIVLSSVTTHRYAVAHMHLSEFVGMHGTLDDGGTKCGGIQQKPKEGNTILPTGVSRWKNRTKETFLSSAKCCRKNKIYITKLKDNITIFYGAI